MPRKTGAGKVGKRRFPRAEFDYTNYDTDPHPDVLVLGFWKARSTNRNLSCGINLHYLSKSQLQDLQRNLDRLFKRDSLRARYRYLRDRLPEIAQYYRTYDQRFVRAVEPKDLSSYQPPAGVDKLRKRALQRTLDAMTGKGSPVRPVAQADKEAWRVRRRLYEPETGKRTSPERQKGVEPGAAETSHQKNLRYRQQRRELDSLEQRAELGRLEAEVGIDEPQELVTKEPDKPDVEPVPESFARPTCLTSTEYLRAHSPKSFARWSPGCPGRRYAVMNIKTGQIVLDCDHSPDAILLESGWRRHDVVWAKLTKDGLLVEGMVSSNALQSASRTLLKAGADQMLARPPQIQLKLVTSIWDW